MSRQCTVQFFFKFLDSFEIKIQIRVHNIFFWQQEKLIRQSKNVSQVTLYLKHYVTKNFFFNPLPHGRKMPPTPWRWVYKTTSNDDYSGHISLRDGEVVKSFKNSGKDSLENRFSDMHMTRDQFSPLVVNHPIISREASSGELHHTHPLVRIIQF